MKQTVIKVISATVLALTLGVAVSGCASDRDGHRHYWWRHHHDRPFR